MKKTSSRQLEIMFEHIASKLQRPVTFLAALRYNQYRKPSVKMWRYLTKKILAKQIKFQGVELDNIINKN
jgi:hypothetical protein